MDCVAAEGDTVGMAVDEPGRGGAWRIAAGILCAAGVTLLGSSCGSATSATAANVVPSSSAGSPTAHPSGFVSCSKPSGCGYVSPDMRFVISPTRGRPGTVVTLTVTGCNDPTGNSHGFGYNAVGDRELDPNEMQREYPHAVRSVPVAHFDEAAQTMSATFRIGSAPRPVGRFNAQCSDTDLDATFSVTGWHGRR